LYAFETVFNNGTHSVSQSEANILGVLSLFFWSLIIVVTVKYVTIVMRASHSGEGGIIALSGLLLERFQDKPIRKALLIFAGLLGVAFFYGDGVITPAISVLSAVEGLEIVSPSLSAYVIPTSLVILSFLFWAQKYGTKKIGFLFGPVMLIWFILLGALGVFNIVEHPHVLLAINPAYATDFLANNGILPFFAMGQLFSASLSRFFLRSFFRLFSEMQYTSHYQKLVFQDRESRGQRQNWGPLDTVRMFRSVIQQRNLRIWFYLL
jgi:KUP system potassium uptake protein